MAGVVVNGMNVSTLVSMFQDAEGDVKPLDTYFESAVPAKAKKVTADLEGLKTAFDAGLGKYTKDLWQALVKRLKEPADSDSDSEEEAKPKKATPKRSAPKKAAPKAESDADDEPPAKPAAPKAAAKPAAPKADLSLAEKAKAALGKSKKEGGYYCVDSGIVLLDNATNRKKYVFHELEDGLRVCGTAGSAELVELVGDAEPETAPVKPVAKPAAKAADKPVPAPKKSAAADAPKAEVAKPAAKSELDQARATLKDAPDTAYANIATWRKVTASKANLGKYSFVTADSLRLAGEPADLQAFLERNGLKVQALVEGCKALPGGAGDVTEDAVTVAQNENGVWTDGTFVFDPVSRGKVIARLGADGKAEPLTADDRAAAIEKGLLVCEPDEDEGEEGDAAAEPDAVDAVQAAVADAHVELDISKEQFAAYVALVKIGDVNTMDLAASVKAINASKKVHVTEKELEYMIANFAKLQAKYPGVVGQSKVRRA